MTTAPTLETRAGASAVTAAAGKMRLLLFVNSVALGGMEEHVRLLARHLDREQFEVSVVAPHWEPTVSFSRAMAGLADNYAEITPDRRYGVLRQCREMVRFFRQVRAWRVQTMHMHSTTYRGQLAALLLARAAGVRVVFVTEHLAPEARVSWSERWLRRLFTRAVTGIVCISPKNYQARVSYLHAPRRAWIVPNGVDPDDFGPLPEDARAALRARLCLPPQARVVGTVVRLEPEKGLGDLLNAFVTVRGSCPECLLLVVGDGSQRRPLEARAAQLGLSGSVRFVGHQDDPRPFLDLMDVFVLPVPVGSMSIGLLEAMAMRRAVVITFGGEGEAVQDGLSGLCAAPHDPASLAAAVTRILRDAPLQAALGAGARRRVEEEFSARHVARRLGRLYTGAGDA